MGTNSDTATRAAAKKITAPARQSPLTGSVGVGGDNNPADVRLVSGALAANNRLTSPSDHNSLDLEAKITTLQQDMGGLKADGLIKPGGPTERRFADLASGGLMKPPSLPGAATPKISDGTFAHSAALTSNPSDEKDGTPAKAWARIQQKKRTHARTEATRAKEAEAEERRAAKKRAKTAETLAEHRKQMKKISTRESLLPKGEGQDEGRAQPLLSDDAISSNARAARYLAGRTGIGDYPRFIADGIAHDGDKAIAEAVDLITQTRARNPKQADALLNRVKDELSPDHQDALNRALDGSPDRPTAKTPTMRDKLYRPGKDSPPKAEPEPFFPGQNRNQNRILLADTKQGGESDATLVGDEEADDVDLLDTSDEDEIAMSQIPRFIQLGKKMVDQWRARGHARPRTGDDRYLEDNSGNEFVQFEDGKIDLGEIDDKVANKAGLPAAPIRLQKGNHDFESDKGAGELHIEARHGDQIRSIVDENGAPMFDDVADYVGFVANNWTEIRMTKGGDPVLIVRDPDKQAKADKQQLLIVQLKKSRSGDFYNVETAGPFVNRYIDKMSLLDNR